MHLLLHVTTVAVALVQMHLLGLLHWNPRHEALLRESRRLLLVHQWVLTNLHRHASLLILRELCSSLHHSCRKLLVSTLHEAHKRSLVAYSSLSLGD